ncbi:ornithine carbamoyltransferase [Egicoccus sp. AB-alg2]|uniref:ornithine carbamoyltransferase n=1 Tax=Egicoccus sp. AB-alg2 TaxID=3242693 RepID=UPI00359D37D4
MTFPDDFLSVDDLTGEQLLQVLDVADQLKADRAERLAAGSDLAHGALRGRTVALVFEKPSTRTRVSFQVAVTELGGQPLPLSSAELQLGRGETIADTGTVLSRYVHAVVVRTFGQDRLEELADAADVPVVNALTDLEHPCQAVADLQTFREAHVDFEGRTLAYVGDGNNVANSLLLAGAKVGLSVRVGHPEGHAPDATILARAQAIGADTGAKIQVTTDPAEAVAGADAVYTDVWASMGQEAQADARAQRFVPYRVTAELMGQAASDAVFLHCLPAHRGEEVTAEVIDGPASRVFDQAENRLHAQKALLAALLA